MKNSAVILAGGFSRRFGQDKGLIYLAGKPLVLHVVDRMFKVVDETVVVVSSNAQRRKFKDVLDRRAKVVVDKPQLQSPLVGAFTGFKSAKGENSLLLPCDTPFISIPIARFLLGECINRGAVIPRWPNGYIEPLQAAYHTKSALSAARETLEQNILDLRSMISHLKGVQYVSTTPLRQIDKHLSFFNINTSDDLRRAESVSRRMAIYTRNGSVARI